MYRVHMITIKQEDLLRAMKIILNHESEFDKITRSAARDNDGNTAITFSFHPYVYEDLEYMKGEFLDAGIQLI